MTRYVLVRMMQGVVVVFLISVITFIIMRVMPGDPVYLLLGDGNIQITEEQIQQIRTNWGLDRPLYEQYLVWAGNLLTGDFGESLVRRGVPVRQMIMEAVPVTALLNLYAITAAILFALPLGIASAVRKNTWVDYTTSFFSALGIATPNFWLSLMLIVVFAQYLRWLPPFGLRSWQGYILPVAVMATEEIAVLLRMTRGAVLELLPQDFVRTARAKGVSGQRVLWRHVMSNAMIAVVTLIGYRFALLLSGTIIVETVFALPGVGRLFTDSVMRLDYQVVQSLVVIFAVIVVVANLITDLVYSLIDPRVRVSS